MAMSRELDLRDHQQITLYSRRIWSQVSLEDSEKIPLQLPIEYVRFTFTGGPVCGDAKQCSKALQNIEAGLKKRGINSLTHNFLVSGHLSIYECRSWFWQSEDLPEKYNDVKHKCLDIAYVGNFHEKDPPSRMVSTALTFIQFGLKQGYISPRFKIIPYEQNKLIPIIEKTKHKKKKRRK